MRHRISEAILVGAFIGFLHSCIAACMRRVRKHALPDVSAVHSKPRPRKNTDRYWPQTSIVGVCNSVDRCCTLT